jgi:hypothetical protein
MYHELIISYGELTAILQEVLSREIKEKGVVF